MATRIKHNPTTMATNTTHNPATMFPAAFKLAEDGAKKINAGQQMMAAAIMARHDTLTAQGTVLASFSAIAKPGEARKAYIEGLAGACGLPARMKAKDGKGDESSVHNARRNSRYKLISRGLNLACDLNAAGVEHTAFHDASGLFRVPAHVLLYPGDTPTGELQNKEKLIPLDGAAYRVVRGKGIADVYASVKAVREAAEARADKPKKNKGAEARAEEAQATGAPLAEVLAAVNTRLNEMGHTMLLVQAAKLLNKAAEITGERGLPTTPWDALEPELRHAIEAVEIFAAECRAAKPAE